MSRPAPGPLSRWVAQLDPLPERLRLFYLANTLGLTVSVASLGIADLFVGSRDMSIALAVLALSWLIPVWGVPFARRYGAAGAVSVLTASAEVWAFGGNWVVPFVAPLAVLVLMVPVMIAIPYLSPRWVAATVLVMLVTAAAASGLAEYRRDVTPVIPLSIRVVCLVVFIPMVVAVIAFEVRQLYLDLSTRAEDLRSSRTQVAAVADAARRSLERDLHDGAQQRLVGLTVQLALVRDQLDGGDVAGARHVLDELNRETHEAIRELRELAQGIYPPLLAERGLVPAVKAAARRSVIPCTVIAEPLPRYPEAVEAAAYFCILEALQNAAKHSGADEVTVQLRADPTLEFAVIDRGRGFDPGAIEHRSGLLGMQARVGAVGGTLRVSSDGDGTVVRGAIPRAQHPDGTTDERADDAVSNR